MVQVSVALKQCNHTVLTAHLLLHQKSRPAPLLEASIRWFCQNRFPWTKDQIERVTLQQSSWHHNEDECIHPRTYKSQHEVRTKWIFSELSGNNLSLAFWLYDNNKRGKGAVHTLFFLKAEKCLRFKNIMWTSVSECWNKGKAKKMSLSERLCRRNSEKDALRLHSCTLPK